MLLFVFSGFAYAIYVASWLKWIFVWFHVCSCRGMVRTRGCNLDDDVVVSLLNAHVKLADCGPRTLFQFATATKWGNIQKNARFLTDLMEKSDGRIPNQVVDMEQMGSSFTARRILICTCILTS